MVRIVQDVTGCGVVMVGVREVGRVTARHGIVDFTNSETGLRRRFVGNGELRRWVVAVYVW